MSTTIMQSLMTFIVSKKIAMLKFLSHSDTQRANLTDYYTDSHFSLESKTDHDLL